MRSNAIHSQASDKAFAKITILNFEIDSLKQDILKRVYGGLTEEQMLNLLDGTIKERKVWNYIAELIINTMTKDQLELKVKELTAALTQFETDKAAIAGQLDKAKDDLKNAEKPIINKALVDELRNAVSEAIGNFNFDEIDHYEYDFAINYDNRVELENIDFQYTDDLEEQICEYIEDLFKVEEDEDCGCDE